MAFIRSMVYFVAFFALALALETNFYFTIFGWLLLSVMDAIIRKIGRSNGQRV